MINKFKCCIKSLLPQPLFNVLVSLKYFFKKVPHLDVYLRHVSGGEGIEIGGPSELFKTLLPLYKNIEKLDGVNFSYNTVWEGELRAGLNYNFFGNKRGVQFIFEATDLHQIKDKSYDFLLSSNCLEHIANPILALMEWKRVLKDGGSLVLALPNKKSNFDHKRPITLFNHIIDDYKNKVTEYDLTHLDEILKLHDLSLDPAAGSFETFRSRSLENYSNRTLHHHVFDMDLIKSLLEYCGFDTVQNNEIKTDFIVLAIKRR
jgi:SAM-dependent methyltransferase